MIFVEVNAIFQIKLYFERWHIMVYTGIGLSVKLISIR